ncbi:MAG: TonB-dependent receptor [Bacteroidales bacterium]|nr:TonB-dependent receptor [Bacteroidales bacterium]
MKLTSILLLVAAMQISAMGWSQDTKLKLSFNEATLSELIEAIEAQSEFRVFYKTDQVNVQEIVTVKEKDGTISSVLNNALSGSNLSYRIMDNVIVLTNLAIEQQQQVVRGTVTDGATGEPLAGVTIQVQGTMTGAISQADGSYSVNIPQGAETLIFSFVGYVTQEIPINSRSVIDMVMGEEITALDEVIVIGYGTQKKSIVTGAISSVDGGDIQSSSISRAEQALQGRTAGVQVLSTSGSPGSELTVRIRGYSSNANADPLYIVDGVKVESISYLSPQDIESMEVLKDAASSAIYGAEGGNGVVMITTKSGRSGYTAVDYDFQYTFENIPKTTRMLNSEEYAQYYSESGTFTIDPADLQNDTDWLQEITEPSSGMRHYLSFTSGTEKSSYLLSASVLDQDGIIVGNKDSYKRYTFRLNGDSRITDWLKVGNNTSFTYGKRRGISENSTGSTINSANLMDPTTPVVYEGAIPAHVQLILDDGQKPVRDENGNIYGISEYISKSPANPFVGLANNNNENKFYTLQGNMFAEVTPIQHVTITSRFGYLIGNTFSKGWDPTYFYNSNNNYNNQTVVRVDHQTSNFWQWENFISYTNSFGGHNLNVLAGMSAEARTRRVTSATGGPMIKEDPNYAELDFISSQESDFVGGAEYLDKKASYFGRLSYDYRGKYLLQGTIRRDGAGASLLPEDNRWGIFPSFSLGWVFTEEEFFPSTFLTFGKLRASWGENGSLSNLSNYMYSSVITSTNLAYQLGDGNLYTVAVPNQLKNPELKWETSVQTDIGLDLGMLNNRVNLTLDYYIKKTTDLITENTPPLESGNAASAVNGGDITNRGFEFSAEYRKFTGAFNYSIMGNIATLHNEVTYLNPTIQRIRGGSSGGAEIFYTAFEKGYPVWYFRDYETDGVDPTTGEANFVDQNNDGLINEGDKTFIGSAIPDVTYGASISLSYKGFDFMATLQGQAGNENMVLWMRNDLPGSNIPKFLYDGRWTADNPNNATVPKAGFDTKTLNSDIMMFNASYMRIKQMQLGYTLPSALLGRIKMKSARIYVSLEDYFTFTNYPGMDPEVGSQDNSSIGIDRGIYPLTKKAIFGISVTL